VGGADDVLCFDYVRTPQSLSLPLSPSEPSPPSLSSHVCFTFTCTLLPQAGFFDSYKTVLPSVSLWTSYGNHDAMRSSSETGQGSGPYFAAFSLPSAGEAGGVPSHTQAYYR
jgi:hypothetical protein